MPNPAIAVAGIGVGGSAIQANQQKQAAKGATAAQVATSQASIAEQRRQFDKMQEVLAPFVQGGESALGGMLDMLGLSGPQKASQAVIDIEASPVFQGLVKQGEEAILANAAATGGLRGGNVQGALAQFRPSMLQNFMTQRFGQLGSLAQMGQASAAGVGAGAMQTGANIGNILRNQGEAQAQGLLARGQATSGFISDAASGISSVVPDLFDMFKPKPQL